MKVAQEYCRCGVHLFPRGPGSPEVRWCQECWLMANPTMPPRPRVPLVPYVWPPNGGAA